MSFLENISETLTSKGKEAAEAARKMAEVANLKSQISGFKSDIKKYYGKIGEAYYKAYKDSDVVCEFEEQVQAIREARKTIDDLEKRIRDLKGDIKCPQCESLIPADSAYCPRCGTKQEQEVEFYDNEEEGLDEYTEDFIVPEEDSEG